jgi:hypothetical protein
LISRIVELASVRAFQYLAVEVMLLFQGRCMIKGTGVLLGLANAALG